MNTLFNKTDTVTLPAYGTVSPSSEDILLFSVHCFDSSFISDAKWRTHVSTMFINRRKTSALLLWNIAENTIESATRWCFWSIACKRSNHLAHNFLKSKFSANMPCTASFEIRIMSASSNTYSLWSSNHISWISFTITNMVAWFGRPLRCSCWQLIRLLSAAKLCHPIKYCFKLTSIHPQSRI